jgi:hypothetical protein
MRALIFILISSSAAAEVHFARDIRPILSDRCFHCHGPDKETRKAKLRLDTREGALKSIVPGKPDESELITRIHHEDPEEFMPPEDSNKSLSDKEKAMLRQWILEGANYQGHWAFIAPERPAQPSMQKSSWPQNKIDHFIIARLQADGLRPAPKASRESLIRRVALDVTGIPPNIAEIDAFLADSATGAYARMVDRYLASPRYGEHMARYWLDLARYADTNGYQYDKERTQWPWRDWVIRAYNANMPFNDFSIEQLAGDLLPEPSTDQLIATGFNRNHPITIEGGIIDEEYRTEYVMDRVVTAGQTWLALSLGCARCHDHKFDPISQDEFYQIYDFFNQVSDRGMSGFNPQLKVQSPVINGQIENIDAEIANAQKSADPSDDELKAWLASLDTSSATWSPPAARPARVTAIRSKTAPSARLLSNGQATVEGRYVRISVPGAQRYLGLAEVQVFSGDADIAKGKKATQSSTGYGGPAHFAVDGNTNGVFTGKSITHTALQADPWWEVDLGGDHPITRIAIWNRTDCCTDRLEAFTLEILDIDRNPIWSRDTQPAPASSVSFEVGPQKITLTQQGDIWLPSPSITLKAAQTLELSGEALAISGDPVWREYAAMPADIRAALADPVTNSAKLRTHLRDHAPARQVQRDAIATLQARRATLAAIPGANVLIMRDLAKLRTTYFLERGQYDQRKHTLTADVPAALGAMADELPRNRLGFARWLLSPQHPLTARVAVNRYWQRLFGVGIVKSLEEFGSQGDWPSHPELIDWLSVEFVQSGWDIKHIYRVMLNSATYRQSNHWTGNDPENRLHARASRFRLDAEVIRDSILSVSGLLDTLLGGPSVYPYQPAGLWMEINNRPGYSRTYPAPAADQLYRRSLYTFWKRTLPHPQMQTFDAPNREFCITARSRTNTPLQALALLNDPQYVEAARHLAQRILLAESADDARMRHGFRLVTGRAPSAPELDHLQTVLREELTRFRAAPALANSAIAVGHSSRDESLDPITHAAWTTIARLLLNLDELLNRG